MFERLGSFLRFAKEECRILYSNVFFKDAIARRKAEEAKREIQNAEHMKLLQAREQIVQDQKEEDDEVFYDCEDGLKDCEGDDELFYDCYSEEETGNDLDDDIDMPNYTAPTPSQFEIDLRDFNLLLQDYRRISQPFYVQLCRRYLGCYEEKFDLDDRRGVRGYSIDKLVQYFREHEDEFNELKSGYLQILSEQKELSGKSCSAQAGNPFNNDLYKSNQDVY